ncbi:NMA1 [Symbiodinium pilosum]|uniref:NMA1 protein n=1 Tax=Symbiodinium pilosum TaxID=2952 RepID=A0A812MK87_SYMPI|nr:NMA1 [Symbiodinium pilosum]
MAVFAAARGVTRAISRYAKVHSRLPSQQLPALTQTARAFSRKSWESGDDVDLDSVAYGFMASQALFSALELGIFDKIAAAGEKGCPAKDVQQACGVEGPRVTTLLTALTAVKCLRRSSEGLYTLSPNTAQYMVSSSKHYYGDYLQYQIGRQFYHRMGALPEVMTTGKAPSYASWFSDPEVAKTYTQAKADFGAGATGTKPRLPWPPTLLHLRMFEEARDAFERAASGRFSIVGGYLSPVHDKYGKATLAPAHHRLKMVEAAVSDSDWLMADGWECTCQDSWTPTVDVIARFANELSKVRVSIGDARPRAGNIRLVMLCGGDVLESFNATTPSGERVWTDEDLDVTLGQHGVVVVGRDDQDLEAFVRQCPLLARHADHITIAQPRIRTGISSSAVRQHLAAGESIRYLVHDKVWRYIAQHRLSELPNWQ